MAGEGIHNLVDIAKLDSIAESVVNEFLDNLKLNCVCSSYDDVYFIGNLMYEDLCVVIDKLDIKSDILTSLSDKYSIDEIERMADSHIKQELVQFAKTAFETYTYYYTLDNE